MSDAIENSRSYMKFELLATSNCKRCARCNWSQCPVWSEKIFLCCIAVELCDWRFDGPYGLYWHLGRFDWFDRPKCQMCDTYCHWLCWKDNILLLLLSCQRALKCKRSWCHCCHDLGLLAGWLSSDNLRNLDWFEANKHTIRTAIGCYQEVELIKCNGPEIFSRIISWHWRNLRKMKCNEMRRDWGWGQFWLSRES